jgi:hypothetical protein
VVFGHVRCCALLCCALLCFCIGSLHGEGASWLWDERRWVLLVSEIERETSTLRLSSDGQGLERTQGLGTIPQDDCSDEFQCSALRMTWPSVTISIVIFSLFSPSAKPDVSLACFSITLLDGLWGESSSAAAAVANISNEQRMQSIWTSLRGIANVQTYYSMKGNFLILLPLHTRYLCFGPS